MRANRVGQAGLIGGMVFSLVLASCAPRHEVAGTPRADDHPAHQPVQAALPAGAPLPTGGSIAAMSDQYAHPRLGPASAAGASSWVRPAPPPAFVISTPLPPGDPPAPPPAAVANRQPSPAPAPAAPAAAPAAPAPAAPATTVDLAKGRELFSTYGCGGCHMLADGGGAGGIGPSLDGNPQLTLDYVRGAIAEGRGAMPAYRDQMSAEEIATLAAYIVQVSRK